MFFLNNMRNTINHQKTTTTMLEYSRTAHVKIIYTNTASLPEHKSN